MPKRKRVGTKATPSALISDLAAASQIASALPAALPTNSRRLKSAAVAKHAEPTEADSGDRESLEVLHVKSENGQSAGVGTVSTPKRRANRATSDSSDSEISDTLTSVKKNNSTSATSPASFLDPEVDPDDLDANPEELSAALSRPPPVNSSYLPLPWKGRLGYACLNTYLRNANPAVFSSRTCRIASILENRHPLKDPSQPAHATKNRPDKTKPADIRRGQEFVEGLGLANARDICTMIRWNEKYGIRFFRLSSEMFPFASHEIYGYKLAPFASEALGEAGKLAGQLGHRLTTHPGQFTQLGSPRESVITASIRDLQFHAELLSLLKLPEQLNRDAVMILHMGGVFGSKTDTLDRFRKNYAKLDQNIKNRLVLENDDVCYSVHDLLPICEELNIPLVLDFHHHNIIFDQDQIREGTHDIVSLLPRIKATWTRKGITQKMHYSEPTAAAITPSQRRKHSPRVATLPPCPPDADLMIEAKDKEQAVLHLMRTFKLPGHGFFNDIVPHSRADENRPWKPPAKKKTPRKIKKEDEDDLPAIEDAKPPPLVAAEEISMGGPENRVFWPQGMEEWLRPKKREVKKRGNADATASVGEPIPVKKTPVKTELKDDVAADSKPAQKVRVTVSAAKSATTPKKTPVRRKVRELSLAPSSASNSGGDEIPWDKGGDDSTVGKPKTGKAVRKSTRGSARKRVKYTEGDEIAEE